MCRSFYCISLAWLKVCFVYAVDFISCFLVVWMGYINPIAKGVARYVVEMLVVRFRYCQNFIRFPIVCNANGSVIWQGKKNCFAVLVAFNRGNTDSKKGPCPPYFVKCKGAVIVFCKLGNFLCFLLGVIKKSCFVLWCKWPPFARFGVFYRNAVFCWHGVICF